MTDFPRGAEVTRRAVGGPSLVGHATVLVMAKAPVPGRVKTRLCPPLDHLEASAVAEAALADTLAAVAALPVRRKVVALDGAAGPWLPDGVEVIAQRGDGLAERLAAAWTDVEGPVLQVGMDTPQVGAGRLVAALEELARFDAVLGLAGDGGWWALGMLRPRPEVFTGIAMSTTSTGARQLRRLRELGLGVGMLGIERDIDTWDDLAAVGCSIPDSRTGRLWRRLAASRTVPGRPDAPVGPLPGSDSAAGVG